MAWMLHEFQPVSSIQNCYVVFCFHIANLTSFLPCSCSCVPKHSKNVRRTACLPCHIFFSRRNRRRTSFATSKQDSIKWSYDWVDLFKCSSNLTYLKSQNNVEILFLIVVFLAKSVLAVAVGDIAQNLHAAAFATVWKKNVPVSHDVIGSFLSSLSSFLWWSLPLLRKPFCEMTSTANIRASDGTRRRQPRRQSHSGRREIVGLLSWSFVVWSIAFIAINCVPFSVDKKDAQGVQVGLTVNGWKFMI